MEEHTLAGRREPFAVVEATKTNEYIIDAKSSS